jgi:hypothetical protein
MGNPERTSNFSGKCPIVMKPSRFTEEAWKNQSMYLSSLKLYLIHVFGCLIVTACVLVYLAMTYGPTGLNWHFDARHGMF